MKNYIYITLLVISGSFFKIRAQTSIQSNINTPSSRYSLQANTDYDIYLRAYVASGTSIQGFVTTFDGESPLEWKFNKFDKDEWVQLKHTLKTTDALVNPVLNIALLSDDALGEGIGEFFVDDIRIVENNTLSAEVLENKINIYPNPVQNGVLYLENIKDVDHITFYGVNGNVIKTMTDLKGQEGVVEQIDVNFLSSGVYVLKVTSKNAVEIKKLIVD